jgi:hypothetical protein
MDSQSNPTHAPAETWRAIPGHEGRYEVSDRGAVRSLRQRNGQIDRERPVPILLRLRLDRYGYWTVKLGSRTPVGVHRLILFAFDGLPPDGYQAAHLNGIRTDNRATNLRWVTPAENQQHRIAHGTSNHGDRNPARLHPERLKRGDAHPLRLHPERVLRGDRNPSRQHPERMARGERVGGARLTAASVAAIRAALAGGEEQRAVARRYGVSQSTVWRVLHGKTWRHV